MIATSTDCLSLDELNRLVEGQLTDAQFDSASKHVDQCEHCQSKLSSNSRLPNSAATFQPPDDSILAESACQFAVARLMSADISQSFRIPIEQIGPYEILGQLGQGGMGMVCLARHNRLKRQCAIKLLPPHRVTEAGWLDRFDREMTTIAALEHPGIVRATDAGTDSGWHYLVMEYLDGMDVGKIAHRLGKLPVADACEITRQAAEALSHVHGSELIHRDIKPSNLMLTRDGTVKLLDLGLVLAGDDPLATDDRLTTVGHLMGTLPAMSPEQLLDSRRVQPASDIYSLGATLYRLISGNWPHANEGGLAARVLAITSESKRSTPPPLRSLAPSVEPELESLVHQMMHRQPEQRPSGTEVADRMTTMCHDANLKALLKRALSTPSSERASTPSLLATIDPPSNDLSRRDLGWFAPLGWFAAAALLATAVIQIKMNDGSVIVTSDGKDTQVEIVESDSVNAANADSTTTSPIPSEKIYLGENLDHWMGVFRREQEIERIGQAMRAVELLSRDTSRRAEAARITLEMANQYGSRIIDETPDGGNDSFGGHSHPNHRFMGYLTQTYPNYFPTPGLDALGETLVDGNQQAVTAAILLLNNYLSGVYVSTVYPERQDAAEEFLRSNGRTPSGRAQIETLLQQLGVASKTLEPLASQATAKDPYHSSPAGDAMHSQQLAWGTAVRLIEEAGPRIEPPAWIAEYVQTQVEKAVTLYRERPIDQETGTTLWTYTEQTGFYGGIGGGFGGSPQVVTTPDTPDWLLPNELFHAAVEMQREGRLMMPIEFAVETIAHPRFNWYPSDDQSVQDVVDALQASDQDAPTRIAFHLDRFLQEIDAKYQQTNNADYASTLTYLRTRLEKGFEDIYVTHVEDPTQAFDRLARLVNMMFQAPSFANSTHTDQAIWSRMQIALEKRFQNDKQADNAAE
ncbi:serine/threonine protein kinase [Rhodopirellula sp. JC740]|uniref:Serine/threonine protein kinase n=1 Tax=Rhodopirellula halodulae TaxID=2894198 RepID=A0ABS8NL24_9BACT|nr:serine/threonine-protein kinase [Rhodopirellula sp. JC740]MCC9644235.1 serine/threonine protein kinase [Rhodopirellula sp. JC740]